MRVRRRNLRSVAFFIGPFLLILAAVADAVFAQGSYQAQVRGTVTDQSGAMVVNATVTITNDATNISQTAHSDEHGEYFFTGLRPAVYTVKAQASGFRISEKKNVVLQVDQQTTVDFVLHPLGVSETIEVTQTAPLDGHRECDSGHGHQQRICARTPSGQPQLLWADVPGGGRDRGGRVRHQ